MQLLLLAAEGAQSGQLISAFKHNPTFMVLNLIVSAVVLTIVAERFIFQLTRYRVNSQEFFAQVRKLVVAGNIDRAINPAARARWLDPRQQEPGRDRCRAQ